MILTHARRTYTIITRRTFSAPKTSFTNISKNNLKNINHLKESLPSINWVSLLDNLEAWRSQQSKIMGLRPEPPNICFLIFSISPNSWLLPWKISMLPKKPAALSSINITTQLIYFLIKVAYTIAFGSNGHLKKVGQLYLVWLRCLKPEIMVA